MKTHRHIATLLCLIMALVSACKSTDPTVKSTEKSIIAFSFASPALAATISGNSITGTLPLGTSASSLVPTITLSPKATVSPASGVAQDFSNAVLYTVTAEDGSTQTYTVTITRTFPTNGLVAYYPFNGNARDGSGRGIDGTVNGVTYITDRKGSNTAVYFNGSSNITFNTVPTTVTDNFSISIWLSISSLSQQATFISNGANDGSRLDGYSFGMGLGSPSSSLSLLFGTGTGSFSLGLDTFASTDVNKWVHLVMVRTSGQNKFYWNGTLRTSASVGSVPTTPTKFTIGSSGSVRFFKGSLDDVRMYNRVLTDSEIQALYTE
ncbi:LamG-like jellyroll fold domain-containing protein [uncultured Fibrella sp.]|uniref:LamG-like jellyroll fold domain-containing protein n=1 Tax=uncultured Fibrella sp. TaxID=1284596 RepID=UPI0035CB7A1D